MPTPTLEKDTDKLLLSAEEVAKKLSVSVRTVHSLNSSGRLPQPINFGRRILWSIEELREWARAGCPPREKWVLIKGTQNAGN